MRQCRLCAAPVSPGRLNIGFSTCLLCGDKLAQEEKVKKSERVGVLYNKGPLMLLTPGVDLHKMNKN